MSNYLDIEAGVEDDNSSLWSDEEDEFRDFIDDGNNVNARNDNGAPAQASEKRFSYAIADSSSRSRWLQTIERIQTTVQTSDQSSRTAMGDRGSFPLVLNNEEVSRADMQLLAPGHQGDWQLWAIRCKKGTEFSIVHEICLRLQSDKDLGGQLSQVLRSAFAPSSDTGFVYFEAVSLGRHTLASRFIKSLPGIGHRRRTLADKITIEDIKDTQTTLHVEEFQSANVVPWEECTKLLEVPAVHHDQFAEGDWIRVKRGRYSGDLGIVAEDHKEYLSQDGIFLRRGVKVLLLPRLKTDVDRDEELGQQLQHAEDGLSSGTKKRKLNNTDKPDQQLFVPDRISCILGLTVKHLSGNTYQFRGDFYKSGLLIQHYDYSSVSPASTSELSVKEYELFEKSRHPDFKVYRSYQVDRAWKLEAGDRVYTDEEGQRKEGVVEGIFSTYCEIKFDVGSGVGTELCRLSLFSVWKKIQIGDFVEVIAGVDKGKSGFVVQSDRRCVVFSHFTDKQDHRTSAGTGPRIGEFDDTLSPYKQIEMIKVHPNSLRVSEPAFTPSAPSAPRSIDGIVVPWIGEQVTSIKGPLFQVAEVKDVKRNPKASDTDSGLMLLVDIALYSRHGGYRHQFLWVDYDWVRTRNEALPLAIARPLGPLQQVYGPNGGYLALQMKTEPAPWKHWRVQIVAGKNKAHGTVQDVRRDPNLKPKSSGLLLYILIDTISAYTPNAKTWVDYDHVHEEQTLELLPAPGVHSYFRLNVDYEPSLHIEPRRIQVQVPNTSLRMQEQAKTPEWNPADLARLRPDHWILNPVLADHDVEVKITGGPFKADSTYIKLQKGPFNDVKPVMMPKERSKSKKVWEVVPVELIQRSVSAPKYKTERNLMIVIKGEHVGKLVHRIRHFFTDKYKTDESAMMELAVVTQAESGEALTGERLELPVDDLTRCKESESQRKAGTQLLEPLRKEALKKWPAGAPEIRLA